MSIEQFELRGENFTRDVWFLPGPAKASHPICVFLDGEHYMNSMNALQIFRDAVASGRIPLMSIAFVSHNGARARHEDYICNELFARFVAKDLLSWARGRMSSIREEGNLVCGVSLSGLASAHIALTYPEEFSSALCQSGSFWWDHQRFATLASRHTTTGPRFWLSVGDKEITENASHPPTGLHQNVSQVVGVQAAVEALRSGGAEVKHHMFRGGHEFGPWTEELSEALQWLTTHELPVKTAS